MPELRDVVFHFEERREMDNLIEILGKHTKWSKGEDGGKRADLSEANLSEADLSEADLSEADLSRADLSRANLSGANLSEANLSRADLSRADLFRANLSGANLSEANLSRADLSRADLFRANLSGANLSEAYLSRADLSGADLSRAKNFDISKWVPDLYILKSQSPKIKLIAYKLLNADLTSPYQNFQYQIRKIYTAEDCDIDETHECGKGLNVATLAWCKREKNDSQIIVKVSFLVRDIIAIPYATDGKFRVCKFKVEEKLT